MGENKNKPTDIQFIQHRLPTLEAGEYELKVTQKVSVARGGFEHTQKIIVQGHRFSLPPEVVVKTFPPKETTGEYGHVLPHLVLKSRTLPWEREVMKKGEHPDKGAAWLALLVFDQTDTNFHYPEDAKLTGYGSAQQGTVQDLLHTGDATIFSGLMEVNLEAAQKPEDPCHYIDVPKDLFAEIAPTKEDLPWLSHVQRNKDSDHSTETSVIMANRLPKEGSMTVVHLVSLEGMGEHLPDENGSLTGIPESAEYIRLVSLHSWTFNPELVKIHFAAYLEHLNHSLKGAEGTATDGLFRLPPPYPDNAHIQAQMSAGYLPLRYRLRNGEQEAAWYRGPFSPQTANTQVSFGEQGSFLLPARSADSLLLFNNSTGLCTASYAAAWQLGRLLALADEAFSTGLYQWKTNQTRQAMVALRQNKHLGNTRKRGAFYQKLPQYSTALLQATPAPDLTEDLKKWLADLLLLRKVPFHYLVPDAKILPKESLKFFCLDVNWLACLFDGAFSIGRSTAQQWERDQAHLVAYYGQALQQAGFATSDPQQLIVNGFLWRSAAVKGWDPGIEAEAYATVEKAENEQPLSCPRWENLAPDTKLALFNGEVKRLIIHEPALGTHFGIDPIPDENGNYTKGLRSMLEGEVGTLIKDSKADIPAVSAARDALNVHLLADAIEKKLNEISKGDPPFTAADFALQMIEGVEGAQFILQTPNP